MRREEIVSKNINFIGCWTIDNENLFDGLINFFENNIQLQNRGVVGSGLNSLKKKTTDITLDPNDLKNKKFSIFNDYFEELFKCYNDYRYQWPFLKQNITKVDIPSFNLQKYSPGDHFSHIHSERNKTSQMHRIFAWMTYLNDIKIENGNTYFSHYDVKVQPRKGKTLIWPAEWTHAHAGEILKDETKYIITGWMCFPFN
jgi:prolyl 4-hydroxylase